ncbi:MAG TPA: condensation domain-containing protein [Longimicrobium sp.]|nr:condensation domain-containing protein [Longimicrobium sp.]
MRRAVEEVVRRHETLRTALPEVDGAPVQRISPPGRVEVPFIDLSHLPEEERDAEAYRLAERNASQPFDLEAGPLFRVWLVRLADDEHLLLVNLHHAVSDGWSMRVLLREIATLHTAFRRGDPSPLEPLPVQYADYAVWQREWLAGPVLEAQLAYWRGRLAGAPPVLELPTDRPRPEVQAHRGASEALMIPPDVAARVTELARREGATVFMVLLAALDVVLSRWSGQEDVVVGTPVAGRTRSELEGLIGLFLNSLALRADLSGDPSFRELLSQIRETTLEAYAHQDVPFERILEELRPERSLGRTPVFQVFLNLLNYQEGGQAGPAGEMTSLGAGAQIASKFDLTLYAGETPDGIALHAVYDADLFDAVRIRAMLEQLGAVLRQAVDDPARPLGALSLHTGNAPAPADGRVVRTARGTPAGIGEVGEVWADDAPTAQLGRPRPDGSIEVLGDAEEWRARRLSSAEPREIGSAAGYVPPATEAERAMAELWREVLGIERVGMEDDFFDLGGHSLLGVRLLARVRQRFGRVLPLGTLFRAPTPRALAAAVAGEERDASATLVPIHEGGALPPFFCVHPAGGTVFHYAEIARLLAPDQPFYGLQAAGVHGEAPPLRTVEEMAERYVAEVRRVQPRGPYFVGGWSAGGIIALEMAERLRAAAEEVGTVAMIDTRTPDFHQSRRVMDQVDHYRDFAASLVPSDAGELDALEAELRALPADDRLGRLAGWMAARGAGLDAAEIQRIGGSVRVFQAVAAATREHHVRPYEGRVDLFCAREGTAGEGMEAAGIPEKWRALGLTGLEVHAVPGTHTSMVQPPHVARLAAALRDALAEARGADSLVRGGAPA